MIPSPDTISGSEREQLQSMKRYLCQLAGELQFALGSVERQMLRVQNTADDTRESVARMHSADTPQARFAAIKSLIIKSADIVEAYYEQINRKLSGQYTAVSDFGTFREETEQQIRETSEGITRAFTNIQAIGTSLSQTQSDIAAADGSIAQTRSDIESVRSALEQANTALDQLHQAVLQVTAWIKTGKLGEDENAVPIYGVEIGQQSQADGVTVFQKFARLLANKLSFFDQNGTEVSSIGDETMYITRAQISALTAPAAQIRDLRLGDYSLRAGVDGHLTFS